MSGVEFRDLVRICVEIARDLRRFDSTISVGTQDQARNDLIFDDILSTLDAGRSPVVITERKDHLELPVERLSKLPRTSSFSVVA